MESPHDTNKLQYFNSDLIYMVIKSKIFIKCNARNLTVETFVRIDSRILMLNAFRQLAMEFPHDTNRLRYFNSDLIYMAIKSKIFTKCNTKEFDC